MWAGGVRGTGWDRETRCGRSEVEMGTGMGEEAAKKLLERESGGAHVGATGGGGGALVRSRA